LLRSTPANEVGLHSEYKKSAFKRTLGSLDSKDLKRAIESLSKRVDKHFNDVSNPSAENAQVLENVWKACADDLHRLTRHWAELVEKCYPDLKLEYSSEEVDNLFRRFKPTTP
jgi:exocyst complex component 1